MRPRTPSDQRVGQGWKCLRRRPRSNRKRCLGSRPGLWWCRPSISHAMCKPYTITLAVFLTSLSRADRQAAATGSIGQRSPLSAVSVVLALAIILLVGGIIGAQLKSLVADAPQYQTTVINKYETLHSTINGLANQVTGRLGPAFKAPERAPGAAGDAEPDQPPLPVVVQNSSSGYLETKLN